MRLSVMPATPGFSNVTLPVLVDPDKSNGYEEIASIFISVCHEPLTAAGRLSKRRKVEPST
jgi:hypothetical protein